MINVRNRCAVLLVLCLLSGRAYSQLEIAVPEKYKDRNVILADKSEHLVIKLRDNKLDIKSHVSEERILMTDIAATVYGQDYVHHGGFHKLEGLEGESYIPRGKSYTKARASIGKTSTAESESFFGDSKKTPLAFTGLVKDAHTRLSYTIVHEDVHFIPAFYFIDNVPIVKSVFKVTVPKEVDIRFILRGDHSNKIRQEVEEGKRDITYTFTATDIPEFESHTDAPNAVYHIPHVIPYVVSYKAGKRAEDSIHVFGKVADLNRYYYNFIKDLNTVPSEYVNKIAGEVTKGDANDRDKARHIYEWVQQNLRYIAFEDSLGGFIPRQAAVVCERKFGDCKDMSSALVAMCRKAGIEAYYTWIGTRDKPYDYEDVPLPIADNHMICTIKLGDEWIFLDGTDNTIPFGVPTAFIQGKEALINMGPDKYKIIRVPEMSQEKNVVADTTYIYIAGNELKGRVHAHYSGYPAWQMAQWLSMYNDREKKDQIKKVLSRGSNKFIQDTAYALAKSNGDVSLYSTFTLGDYLQVIGDEYYVNLNIQRAYSDGWVDREKRKVPISYKYKSIQKQTVIFNIPEGFQVTYVPPPDSENAGAPLRYSIGYLDNGKQVVLEKELGVPALLIEPSRFEAYNKSVEGLKRNYKESIVLKAIK